MCRNHHRFPLLLPAVTILNEHSQQFLIQMCCRLIGKDDIGIVYKSSGNNEPLLLSSGDCAYPLTCLLRKPKTGEYRSRNMLYLPIGHSGRDEGKYEVFSDQDLQERQGFSIQGGR